MEIGLLTIWLASATVLYSTQPMGASQLRFDDPLDVSTHEEQQTPRATMTSPYFPLRIAIRASLGKAPRMMDVI